MKNKNLRGILALAVVTALSFSVILGSRALSHNIGANTNAGASAGQEAKVLEELDVTGIENIEKAVKTADGYMVTVRTKGYAGDILMNVSFDAEGKKVTKAEVVEQGETEGVGSLIAEADFLNQFSGVTAPVYLPGMTLAAEDKKAEKTETSALMDGTYEAKTTERDKSGYIGEVSVTVENGKIVSAAWECVDADGNKKSVQSENGEYVMTEDGPTWKAQAEAVAAALVAEQSLDFFNMQENGKIDTVSGVSISISEFVNLAEECLKEASGEKKAVALADGTYEAKTTERDKSGYITEVSITVENGKIASAVWECVDADGNKKSVQSENGEYVMTEDGPTWKAQAEAVAAALVAEQSLDFFNMQEDGKIDTVSGVSISIAGFVNLAEECLKEAAGEKVVLADGTYEAKTTERDKSGYITEVSITVENGKIASAVWECVDADGNKKSVQSENGEYVMTEDGLTWKAQAEAVAAALVAEQSLDFFNMQEDGKIDTVSGVSISIAGFVNLAEECLKEAAGVTATEDDAAQTAQPQDGTQVDAVSGATISSAAAVKGINAAYNFLQTVR